MDTAITTAVIASAGIVTVGVFAYLGQRREASTRREDRVVSGFNMLSAALQTDNENVRDEAEKLRDRIAELEQMVAQEVARRQQVEAILRHYEDEAGIPRRRRTDAHGQDD